MSDVTANFATDRQQYQYGDEVWEFYVRVNFDSIIHALARRAKRSKRLKATALSGGVSVTACKVSP